MVNPDGDKDRVSWACGDCGKVFRAHCGLDISPANGYTYRRNDNQQNAAQGGEST